MSAIAHVPGATWAAAHRALSLALVLFLSVVTDVATLAVLLTTQTPTSGSGTTPVPELPRYEDTCRGYTPGTPC
jgi:hypothetical protein